MRPAWVTVLHNGVLVQDNAKCRAPPKPPAAALQTDAGETAAHLQDHGNPVRFRNIWIRELGEGQ